MEEMKAKINIKPISRATLPGAESKFEVTVEGAEVSRINVRPCDAASSYKVSVAEMSGGTRTVTIKTPSAVSANTCLDFFVEALDGESNIVGREHIEIVTAPKAAPPFTIFATIVGIILVVVGLTGNQTWAIWSLLLLGVFIALAVLILGAFGIYGRYKGFPWHFTSKKTEKE